MAIKALWSALGEVRQIELRCAYKGRDNFRRECTAAGDVTASKIKDSRITFTESGEWTAVNHKTVSFFNVYRWSLIEEGGIIRLEHLRFGIDNPVFLVDFAPVGNSILHSMTPHLCGADRYSATLSSNGGAVHLSWIVQGPTKSDEINCVYRL